ncbi:MAG TPA: hypothetical protein VD735_05345 [Candidatus Saccharimonadales bacterium]|nr:hypothetical protein [Candidatus Saccharimonadales bacterium]
MPNNYRAVRVLSRGAAFGLQAGVLVWIVLLLQQAVAAQNAGLGIAHRVTFGPLTLISLGKEQIGDTLVAHFSFEDGLIAYFGFWLLAGTICAAIAGAVLSRRSIPPKGTNSAD